MIWDTSQCLKGFMVVVYGEAISSPGAVFISPKAVVSEGSCVLLPTWSDLALLTLATSPPENSI